MRYHQPQSPVSDNRAAGTPRPSNDQALTSFAQLGALRLNAKRAFISFFDRKYQYVLAEATRTLSLQDGSIHEPGDSLWLGTETVPYHQGLCWRTAGLPEMLDSDRDVTALIINDLALDKRVPERPVGVIPANARFYAGVPIRSPGGYGIGMFVQLSLFNLEDCLHVQALIA